MGHITEVFVGHVNFILSKESSSQNGLSKGAPWFDVHSKMRSLATLWQRNGRGEARVETRPNMEAAGVEKEMMVVWIRVVMGRREWI